MSKESQGDSSVRQTVRALRSARGWTQFELAAEAKVSLSSVVNIEAGRQEPRVTLAEKIARALGVSVGDIAWPEPEQLEKRPKEKSAAA